MTREKRLELLKQIEKDIHVCSLESTLLDDAKSCAIHSVIEELEQEPVLDKLRAEIETKYGQCDICEYFEDYDYEENAISEYRSIGNIADILQMIDQYKVESEEKA